MDALMQDLRYAVRQLIKNPGFTILAICTFALGIGPATAVLSFADRLVMSPIPGVEDADRLAIMRIGIPSPRGYSPYSLRGDDHKEFMKDLPAIAALAGFQRSSIAVSTGGAPAQEYGASYVSGQYFKAFGLNASPGRVIDVTDDTPGGAMVAVISHDLWDRAFGRASDVVGKAFRVNGEVATVIGVAPRGFHGPDRLGDIHVWMPGSAQGTVGHYPPSVWPRLGYFSDHVLRLSPTGTFESAKDQLKMAMVRVAARHPEDKDWEKMEAMLYPGIGVEPLLRDNATSMIRFLLAAAGLLLIVACANAANLMLFRGAQKRGEIALRHAIGATRSRLVVTRVGESVLLAVAGGAAGTLIALAMIRWFEGANIWNVGAIKDVTLNWRVLLLGSLAAVTTGLLAGVLPAYANRNVDLVTSLKESQRTGTGVRSPVRSGLAVLQVAISLTLLVGSFLFVRTLANLRSVNLGFDPTNLTTSFISIRSLGYAPDRSNAFGAQLLERIRAVPGVQHASLSYTAPLHCCRFTDRLLHSTSSGEDTIPVYLNAVSPSYFPALGMRLLDGRPFTDADMQTDVSAAGPVIISEALAKRLFGNTSPIGKTIRFRRPPELTVVGVAPNVLWNDLTTDLGADLSVYRTTLQLGGELKPGSLLMIRSTMDLTTVQRTVSQLATAIDPNVPLVRESTMQGTVDRYASEQALFMKVLTLLAVVAVSLASIGLYGLVAQSVTERNREFGIRAAVGATAQDLLSLVARQGAKLVLLGIPLGLISAFLFSRAVRAKLFGVAATEPLVYVGAAAALVIVASIACMIPARAAARVDPMIALRSE